MALGSITRTPLNRRTEQARVTGWRLEGADELEATLLALEARMQDRIVVLGLRAGAEVLRRAMADRAARVSRRLSQGIVTALSAQTGVKATVEIGPHVKIQMLGYWFEFGTGTHGRKGAKYPIIARAFVLHRKSRRLRGQPMGTKRALSFDGKAFHSVQHPGMRPRPSLVEAFVRDTPRALHEMGRVMWAEIRKVVERKAA
jgi:hypothetical protein